jgi:single-strand DNA-binding protein
MYQNRLSIIGFTGKGGEQKFTKSGIPVTILSVATKESWKNKDTGDWESRTEWHRVVCWSKLAEFAGSLKSGAHIQVEGELRSREYQKDGVTHRIWECKASRIAKLDRMERADDNSSADESVENEPPLWGSRSAVPKPPFLLNGL